MQEELSTTGKKAGKWAKNAAAQSETIQDQVTDTARSTVDKVTETASEYISSFNSSPLSFIREYPIQAALGGIVLGFLLGSAVSRNTVSE